MTKRKVATDYQVCTIEDIGLTITCEDPQPFIDAINEYLSIFAKPIKHQGGLLNGSHECLKCGERLDGALGTFRWGLVNGEGYCGKCTWPCRMHHRPKTTHGAEIFDGPLHILLQYHPRSYVMDSFQRLRGGFVSTTEDRMDTKQNETRGRT